MVTAPLGGVADTAERAGRSKERTDARAATGPVLTPDLQPEEALPAVGVVEQSSRFEGQTGARMTRDLQSEDAPSTALVGES